MKTNKTMSTIDLIVLGILQKKQMNAYEITHFIDEMNINRLIKISSPAVYKVCKRLYKSEFLNGKTIRDGENPEKIVYSVNAKGKTHFYNLMHHFSSQIQPFFFDFNTFLWNIDQLEPQKSSEMLGNLQVQLRQLRDWVVSHEKEVSRAPFAIRMIVKQYRMTLNTLVKWITEVVQDFEKENKKK
ncbi:MAG: PadR family transcriptional regulator [Leptospirales bacterium]